MVTSRRLRFTSPSLLLDFHIAPDNARNSIVSTWSPKLPMIAISQTSTFRPSTRMDTHKVPLIRRMFLRSILARQVHIWTRVMRTNSVRKVILLFHRLWQLKSKLIKVANVPTRTRSLQESLMGRQMDSRRVKVVEANPLKLCALPRGPHMTHVTRRQTPIRESFTMHSTNSSRNL